MDKAMIFGKVKELFPDYEMEMEIEEPEEEGYGSGLIKHVMNDMTDMLNSASLEEKIEAVKIILS